MLVNSLAAALALVSAFSAFQTVYFLRQIQKLIDKLMSRSYTEYSRAQEPIKPIIKTDNDPAEDLGPLSEF